LAELTDPREKLREIARLHLERLGADRDLAVVFQVELRGSTKFMEEFSAAGFAEYLGLIRDTFEEGQRAGLFRRELRANTVAKILFGALDEMATNWILSPRRYRLTPAADEVLDIILGGISAR
jgi:TetR/AcrR family fatty acid metabolism transcriptional regulator